MSLYELLEEMQVPPNVVQDVKHAEDRANTAFAAASRLEGAGGFLIGDTYIIRPPQISPALWEDES